MRLTFLISNYLSEIPPIDMQHLITSVIYTDTRTHLYASDFDVDKLEMLHRAMDKKSFNNEGFLQETMNEKMWVDAIMRNRY